jgi:hypothetical protein
VLDFFMVDYLRNRAVCDRRNTSLILFYDDEGAPLRWKREEEVQVRMFARTVTWK